MSEEPKIEQPSGMIVADGDVTARTEQTELFGAVSDDELLQSLTFQQGRVTRGMAKSRAIAAELDRRSALAGEGPNLATQRLEALGWIGGHVYTGPPDARQAGGEIKPTRFRPRYRALTPVELALRDQIKATAAVLETHYNQLVFGRYHALAMTALEESVFWAVKGLTE